MSDTDVARDDQGWYPDPAGRYDNRYWLDGSWTTWVAVKGSSTERSLPDRSPVTPMAALPPRSLWWALAGYLVAIVTATAAAFS